MSEAFLGEIRLAGFSFAPQGWALCNGQVLSIAQNQALFALLGTMYGGNGTTTFALPDLRGRVGLHQGTAPGGTVYTPGEVVGAEQATLTTAQLPPHTHTLAGAAVAQSRDTTGGSLANGGYYADTAASAGFDPAAVSSTGGAQPFPLVQPVSVLNYIIALQGIFPSRN